MRLMGILGISVVLALSVVSVTQRPAFAGDASGAQLLDSADGRDWVAYGRTYGEQHYSPLTQIDSANVSRLGLAWFMDLGAGNSTTVPLTIGGILYFASGHSHVHAVNAVTGELLWTYDPEVVKVAGIRLKSGWGSRGIAYWNGKIYTATTDGRLIAIDANTGKPVWRTMTLQKGDLRFITGAPRVFDGKVIIGHGGADSASIRGYVTTYDAETGKQLWRFLRGTGKSGRWLRKQSHGDGGGDVVRAMVEVWRRRLSVERHHL